MANTISSLKKQIGHFKDLWDANPIEGLDKETAVMLVEKGLINLPIYYEQTIEEICNIKRVDINGMDFENGDDAKMATTYLNSKVKRYETEIRSIKNKTGNLLCNIYNINDKQNTYIKIPHSYYSKKFNQKSPKITIRFSESGQINEDLRPYIVEKILDFVN